LTTKELVEVILFLVVVLGGSSLVAAVRSWKRVRSIPAVPSEHFFLGASLFLSDLTASLFSLILSFFLLFLCRFHLFELLLDRLLLLRLPLKLVFELLLLLLAFEVFASSPDLVSFL
jgi:hypothetical protein